MCLDPARFPSASGLAWQAALIKNKVKLDLLTDIDMLLMVEKSIRRGICGFIYRYAETNSKYMKDYENNKELSYLQYWDVNNLYGWAMSQMLQYLENYMTFTMTYHFYLKEWRLKKSKSL